MDEAKYSMVTIGDVKGFGNVPTTTTELILWLERKAPVYGFRWLLAHSDNGVNWGRFVDGSLTLSFDVAERLDFVPELQIEHLQQIRLFGGSAELLLWQSGEGMTGRLIQDEDGEIALDADVINECHLLWGVQTDQVLEDGFIIVSEADGLRHVVPWSKSETQPGPRDNPKYRLHLKVRHYVGYDEDGQAYVKASRLVDLGSHVRTEVEK